MEGWIKIHRKIQDWEWYSDSETVRVFIHLLLNASHAPTRYHGIIVNRGQVITWRSRLAKELRFSEQQIKTALKKLKLTGEITMYSTNIYSVITIIKYGDYQYFEPANLNSDFKENQEQPATQPAKTEKSTSHATSKTTSKTTSETTSYEPTTVKESAGVQPAKQPANQPAEQPAINPANSEKSTSNSTTIQEVNNYKQEIINRANSKNLPQPSKSQDLEKRQQEFYLQIAEFKSTYLPNMLREFFNYWSEPNKSRTKQRYELQQTWELKRRLETWAARDKNSPSNNQTNETAKRHILGSTSAATGAGAFGKL
jgi:hypothetical protein